MYNKQAKADTEYITESRPKEPDVTYVTCKGCCGYFRQSAFRKHKNRCVNSSNIDTYDFPAEATEELIENVLSTMREDQYYHILRKDKLILEFGSRLLEKNATEYSVYKHVAQKMREIARLLYHVQKLNKTINCMKELFYVKNYDRIIQAVQNMCGFNKNGRKFTNPTLALKTGYNIIRLLEILEKHGGKDEDSLYLEQLDHFKKVHVADWAQRISHHARQTSYENAFNKPLVLPTDEDITTLIKFLKGITTAKEWQELAELVLSYLIVFNRRRVGDVHKLHLKTYVKHNSNTTNTEFLQHSLNPMECKLSEYFTAIHTRDKTKKNCNPFLPNPHYRLQFVGLNKINCSYNRR